jgi:hypothetical protein
MDIAILFEWFTHESMEAALQATEWKQREIFLRLALLWGAAAQQVRKEASEEPATPPPPPPCVKCGTTTVVAPAFEVGQRVFVVRCPACMHSDTYSLDYDTLRKL